MDRYDFFVELNERLTGLPQEDIDKTIDFYGEMIDERVEDGMSEQEAVAAIGTPKQIAESIWKEMPFFKVVKANVKQAFQTKKKDREQKQTKNVMATVLFWVGSPIWLCLGLALIASLFAVLVAIYASLWATVVSLWAGFVSIVAGAAAGVLSGTVYFIQANVGGGMFLLGCGILLIGLAVFMHYTCVYASKAMRVLSKQLIVWTKMLFVKKEKIQ